MPRDALTPDDLATVAAGLRWLYLTEQPAGAQAPRWGATSPVLPAGRRYQFSPRPDPILDPRSPASVALHNAPVWSATAGRHIAFPLHSSLPDALVAAVEGLGWPTTTVTAIGPTAVSVGLATPPHPTVAAAADTVCSVHAPLLAEVAWCCVCAWARLCRDAAVAPEWPVGDQPLFSPAFPSSVAGT